jgi:hypothetical protein
MRAIATLCAGVLLVHLETVYQSPKRHGPMLIALSITNAPTDAPTRLGGFRLY